jgi:hypothetical protein
MSRCPECDKALTGYDLFGHDCEVQACACPSCSPDDGSDPGDECFRNFCALCRAELGYESDWPDLCGRCIADEYRKQELT